MPPTPDIAQLSMKGRQGPGTLVVGVVVLMLDQVHGLDRRTRMKPDQPVFPLKMVGQLGVRHLAEVLDMPFSFRFHGGASFLHRHNHHTPVVKPLDVGGG